MKGCEATSRAWQGQRETLVSGVQMVVKENQLCTKTSFVQYRFVLSCSLCATPTPNRLFSVSGTSSTSPASRKV